MRPVGSGRDSLAFCCGSILALFVFVIILLILSDVRYLTSHGIGWNQLFDILRKREVIAAMRLSLLTSLASLALVLLFSIPIGYAMSRFRFPGHSLIDAIIDIPIVLPPVVIGVSLLAFFGTGMGMELKKVLRAGGIPVVSAFGIVICQSLVAVSYCIRAAKAAFDDVRPDLEHVAMVLGCSPWQAFWKVSMPLARTGLIAGGVMAWARSIGVFGPLMVFVGTGPRVQVMPTAIWLELSIGNIEVSLTIALVMVSLSVTALCIVHRLAPGRDWS